jgi:hypothetical protein
MNTLQREKRDATIVGVLLDWKPLADVERHEMGALISELRENKEWSRDRCEKAIRAYRTHRRIIRQLMGLKLVSEVAG